MAQGKVLTNMVMTVGAGFVNLVDGQDYSLGACEATYNARFDVFCLGNCIIERWQTIYADQTVVYNNYGFPVKG